MEGTVNDEPFVGSRDPVAHRVAIGLVKIGLALKSHDWREAGQRGLTPTQGQILAVLRLRSERGLRLTDLAEGLAVTPATVSDAVAALAQKGLVQKQRAHDDARAVAITLTETGAREADRVAGWPDFLLEGVEALSSEEQTVFLRGLVKMIRTLQERGQIPISRMCVTCRFFHPYVHDNAEKPHHCAFVDAPFGDRHLRLECPDHEAAPPDVANRAWATFVAGPR